MQPTEFPESNAVLGEGQPEYTPMPVYRYVGDEGRTVSVWRLSFWERLRLIFTGRIYVQVLTFRTPIQPQLLTVEKPDMPEHTVIKAPPAT